jgi:hypothetical protein
MRLSELPTPSFAEMHFQAYQKDDDRMVPFQLSRGCTDKCEFCSEWVFWRRFRPDAPDNAVEKIKELQRDYGTDFIIFTDSLLNGVPKRLVEFAERLLTEEVKIRWASFMRAQMDTETARLLARSGCNDVFIGIESFSDETLELMRKRRTKAQNIEAIEAFLGAGIGVTAGFVPGFPGDSREGFTQSAMMLRTIQERFPGKLSIQCEAFVVQPNAPIYNKLEQMGLIPKGFDDEYLDVAPDFRDISSKVMCSVEGSNQGFERLARTNMVKAIMTDDVAIKDYSFDSGAEETLTLHAFDFDHLVEGWHLARKKSSVGHEYGLLLTQKETEELEELQAADPIIGPAESVVTPILERVEAAHIIPPSRFSPRVVRSVFCQGPKEGSVYAASPFVIVRGMGWKQRRRVLIANLANERHFLEPAIAAPLLSFVNSKPRTEEELQRFWDELGCSRNLLRKTLADLLQNGTLVICEVREESRVSAGEQVIEQATMSVSALRLPIVAAETLR